MMLVAGLTFAGLAAALPKTIEPRQFVPMSTYLSGKPAVDFVVAKTLTPEIDPKATRQLLFYGPYKMPSRDAKHGTVSMMGANGIKLDKNSDVLDSMIKSPCTDCTVLKANAQMAYQNGTIADVSNGIYTHHTIIVQHGRSMAMIPVMPVSCKNPFEGYGGGMNMNMRLTKRQELLQTLQSMASKLGLIPALFVAGGGSGGSGAAFAVRNSDVKTGIQIAPSDKFQYMSELVNYDPWEKNLYLALDVEWVPGRDSKTLAANSGGFGLTCTVVKGLSPAHDKATDFVGEPWKVLSDGYILDFTPHLHDGGVNMKLLLNDKEVCESSAVYGTDSRPVKQVTGNTTKTEEGGNWQTISGYSSCPHMPIAFKKGDTLKLAAKYDLTKYRLRPDSAHEEMEVNGENGAMAIATYEYALTS